MNIMTSDRMPGSCVLFDLIALYGERDLADIWIQVCVRVTWGSDLRKRMEYVYLYYLIQ
jgi:hypothetical protein